MLLILLNKNQLWKNFVKQGKWHMRSGGWQLKANFAVCAAALGFSRTKIENLYHKYSIKGNIDPRSGRPPEKNKILKDFILQQDHFQTLVIQQLKIIQTTHAKNSSISLINPNFLRCIKEKISVTWIKMISGFSQMNQIFRNTKGNEDQILIEKINSYNVLMIWGQFQKMEFLWTLWKLKSGKIHRNSWKMTNSYAKNVISRWLFCVLSGQCKSS